MTKTTIKHTIYMMKQPGTEVAFYQQSVGTVNRLTGVQSMTRTVYVVDQAIVLPRNVHNEIVVRDVIVQTKYEVNDVEILVDVDDIDFDISQIDYVVFDGRRYNIHNMYDIEKQALYLHLRESQNQQGYQEVTEHVRQTLTLVQTITGEVS
jgi:hypothetical protein